MRKKSEVWSIAVRREATIAFFGIADRLSDGKVFVASPEWPALEEVAGDDWSNQLLSRVLPLDQAWAWWTRTEVLERAKLGGAKAPDIIELAALAAPVYRKRLLSRMALAIAPPSVEAQKIILDWAGNDTEHVADILVTVPSHGRCFVSDLFRWCNDGALVRSPKEMLGRGFERIVVIHDGFFYVALAPGAVDPLAAKVEELAQSWGIELAIGNALDPWPFSATG